MTEQSPAGEGADLVLVEHPARRRGPDGAPLEPAELLPGVALVTLNRPRALNALSFALLLRLAEAVEALDADPACRAIVVTGAGTRAFAAGADVAELAEQTTESLAASPGFRGWDRVAAVATPTIAAVRGYALGGGAELAMACDMVVAAEDATFGQPEIRLGIIPGAGGTQRLARVVGKARAMELVLTGRRIPAPEAERLGLVTRVVPPAETLAAALDLAAAVAAGPPDAVRAAVAAIRAAFEEPLADGIAAERRRFGALFGTADQEEGMRAFLERREPRWQVDAAAPARAREDPPPSGADTVPPDRASRASAALPDRAS
jgi:enoyl-CoA hydratase